MPAKIIDGTAIAAEIRESVRQKVSAMDKKPGLAVVLVGDNPASKVYVSSKKKACEQAGIHSEKHELPETVEEKELLALIKKLNKQKNIHGILVQLPLPAHIDEQNVLKAVDPKKDVDGFNPVNMGNLLAGNNTFVPATPLGIIRLIESTGEKIEGKHAVVIGRSNIVGKPVALLLLQKNATVTVCHSRTNDLVSECRNADILVAAIGRPKMITKDYIKPGAIVIDVGISREDGKIVGDVDFNSVKEAASYITPVPGGVGPMTIAMLLENTLQAAQ